MANVVDEPYLLINQVCLEPGQNVPEHQANSNVTLQVLSAVVEHESKETYMAMHLSDDRQSLFKKVRRFSAIRSDSGGCNCKMS